jgi:phage-related baseplate assembly protein
MNRRFFSKRLDLSRIQAIRPALILDLDYEAIVDARLASLQERLPAVDTLGNPHNPMVALQEEDGYRQLLDYGLLNDRVRGLLAILATGTDLDHVAARAGIERLVLTRDSDGNPLTYEDDETLRMRYFASFGAPAAGSEDAYVFAALTAFPQAWHVLTLGPAEHGTPGQVDVVITSADGETTPEETVLAVARAVSAKNVRPLTDFANVLAAIVEPYAVQITVAILPGPDPQVLRDQIIDRIVAITDLRYRAGGEVPRSAIAAAGFDMGALDVTVTSPSADIPRDPYVAPYCSTISVTVVERLYD